MKYLGNRPFTISYFELHEFLLQVQCKIFLCFAQSIFTGYMDVDSFF